MLFLSWGVKIQGTWPELPGSFRGNWVGVHATVVVLAFSSIDTWPYFPMEEL